MLRLAKDELKKLKKEIEKIDTMHNVRVEHLEAVLPEKEAQEKKLADANIIVSYDLV